MSRRRWLPKIVQRSPDRQIRFAYQVPGAVEPGDPDQRVARFCATNGVSLTGAGGDGWNILFHATTRVFGFVPREVEETVSFRLEPITDGFEIRAFCEPSETQAAHAVGAFGVLVFAVLAWIAGGPSGGALAALATVAAGWLVVEVTRHWAFDALENRVRALTQSLGRSFWRKKPGQLL